jgi:phenylalanyl-tRNA synthetase alpha chain
MEIMESSARELYATPEKRPIKPRNYDEYFENIRKVHEGDLHDDNTRPFGTIG